jgi:hypothetical protein
MTKNGYLLQLNTKNDYDILKILQSLITFDSANGSKPDTQNSTFLRW